VCQCHESAVLVESANNTTADSCVCPPYASFGVDGSCECNTYYYRIY